ncbi:hypothetical protein H7X69_00680 [Candidatus Saccharibacteria bacterium]|nr:hypothetical protein [Candidatus Saccharibacteria bacterium]
MDRHNSIVSIIATFVVASLVGGTAGYAIGVSKNDTESSESSSSVTQVSSASKAADLRAVLNNLETEHVDLASAATRAGFDGSPMFDASAASLDQNSVDLSKAIGSVYGAEAEAKFLEIWRSHIGFFVDYTVAAKAGETAGTDKAVQNLNGYVEAISDFLSKANPDLPKDAVASLITEHVNLLKSVVDKHAAGDYEGSHQSQEDTRTQIQTKIADTLSGAIIKQSPNKFKD